MRRTYLVSALLGLTLFLVWGRPMQDRALVGENDFLQLYAGARLVGTPDLYNPQASYDIEKQVTRNRDYYPGIYYTRLPWYALVLKPLASLPYRAAYVIFQLVAISAVLAFLLLYARKFPNLLILAAMSPVLLVTVANGQDVGLAVAIAAFSLLLASEFTAGLLLAICTIKFHLFLLLPLAVLQHRRWRYLAGAATGVTALFALSTAAQGWNWWTDFAALLSRGDLHTDVALMPNWRGFAAVVGGGLATELILSALTLAVLIYTIHRTPNFRVAAVLTIVASVLIGHHAYMADLFALLLVAAVIGAEPVSRHLKAVAVVAALPITPIFILLEPPYSALAPILLASILITAAIDAHHSQKRLARGDGTVGEGGGPGPEIDRRSAPLPRPGPA